MDKNFTNMAKEAIRNSQNTAIKNQNPQITDFHLLYGLLEVKTLM